VIRYKGEGVGAPGVGIDGVVPGRFDRGSGDGGGLGGCFRSDEEVVVATEGDGAHAAFGGGVIQFEDAVVAVGAQAFHAGQGIANGGGGRFSARGVVAARRLGISAVVGLDCLYRI